MRRISRVVIAACLAIVSFSACAPKGAVVEQGCKGLSIAYDPALSFLKIGVTSTQLYIAADYQVSADIADPASVLNPVALVSLPPIPFQAFTSLYNNEQDTLDYAYNQAGRDFLTREVGAENEPLFNSGSAVAGVMEGAGKKLYFDLRFDARAVNSASFIGDKNNPITIYLVAAKGKYNQFTCKSIDKFVLTKDNLKVIDE